MLDRAISKWMCSWIPHHTKSRTLAKATSPLRTTVDEAQALPNNGICVETRETSGCDVIREKWSN
ncbi:unnamed protein product [Penicillium roqueforti FM164]|uniref:Uncharacterized protein n=1 Tax=Penicillium roqueforti (strain FM164) TaxID=1365484 RepID=W6R864_PENRF|nr:unnamed protein product [Penicillium roqueforti FM164]